MDSSVSQKDEIWFLRVCHHVSNAVYTICCLRSDCSSAVVHFKVFNGKWEGMEHKRRQKNPEEQIWWCDVGGWLRPEACKGTIFAFS